MTIQEFSQRMSQAPAGSDLFAALRRLCDVKDVRRVAEISLSVGDWIYWYSAQDEAAALSASA
jgi:hypothetical protein